MMKDRGGPARSYRSKKAGGRGGDENKPGTPTPSSCQAPLREDGEVLLLKAARDHIERKITNLVVKVRVEKMLEGLS